MTYEVFKYLPCRTASDILFRNKVFNFVKNLKCDRYQMDLASVVYKFW